MNRLTGVLVGAVLLLAATSAWAQATAQINGTVADSSGAVLPGVTVVAIQTDTGFRREAVTDAEGNYALLNLAIGPYRLEASLQGFRSFAQTGITLTTEDIDATHAEMKSRGVDVDDEVSRMGDPVPPMFWFRDPTGHSLMVVEQR